MATLREFLTSFKEKVPDHGGREKEDALFLIEFERDAPVPGWHSRIIVVGLDVYLRKDAIWYIKSGMKASQPFVYEGNWEIAGILRPTSRGKMIIRLRRTRSG